MRPAAIGLSVGAVVGAGVAAASRGPTLVQWPDRVRTTFPFVLGGLVGAGAGAAVGSSAAAVQLARGRTPSPGLPVAVGALVGVGSAVVAVGRHRLLEKMAADGRGLDPAFAGGPVEAGASGSAVSLVPASTLGREGARFVGTMTTADDVRAVTGQEPVASPVRIFVGVESASTVAERVALAMAELRRTGAFDRANLLIEAPAGSGYANATPVDVLEILSRGDVASVAIGYGLLPSFLSLGRVDLAAQTQLQLLEAVTTELAGRSRRPRLLLYGESLGAKVQQAAIPAGLADLDRFDIAAALWVGTPGGTTADAFHRNCADSSIRIDRPEQIPMPLPAVRPRVWFLEHDGDPVVRFRPEVFRRRPDWLPVDGTRGRNVPQGMGWKPGITWAQSLVDTMFATNVKPGDFQSLGHDYRADLGAVVTAAFGLTADAAMAGRLEEHLRFLEVQRAARIAEKV